MVEEVVLVVVVLAGVVVVVVVVVVVDVAAGVEVVVVAGADLDGAAFVCSSAFFLPKPNRLRFFFLSSPSVVARGAVPAAGGSGADGSASVGMGWPPGAGAAVAALMVCGSSEARGAMWRWLRKQAGRDAPEAECGSRGVGG